MKIAITGKSVLHLCDAPWSDYNWEIWHLNDGYHNNRNILPRFDKYFEIHDENEIEKTKDRYQDYKQFLIDNQDKLISNKISFLPNSEIYPYKDICEKFNTKFFKNSISYMIAYALYKYPDMEELGLWGIELHSDMQYHDQEDCVSYWIGRAEAMGIKVQTSMHSSLLKLDNYYSKLFEGQ